ncbi:hypothetical protein C8Q76DRAFT_800172 [Earliella scabrosa]|nr:hypothetical protein C8Q76DRAFT_800172 [Earliella scabrosa]
MNATVSWQDEPNIRGTYSILTSCISTLFICTWSALHLDIPDSDQSSFMRLLDKLGWLVIGLLAPEYLLILAINQYLAARDLTKFARQRLKTPAEEAAETVEDQTVLVRFVRWIDDGFHILRRILVVSEPVNSVALSYPDVEAVGAPDEAGSMIELRSMLNTPYEAYSEHSGTASEDSYSHSEQSDIDYQYPVSEGLTTHRSRNHPWTLAHSFWVIMGGFVLQDPHVKPPKNRYLPAWQGNGVLTEYGFRLLMEVEPDLIPDIPVDELLDRGKADGLAKMLLAWQILWFCLSCVSRTVQHLPLSLLEITTIAHALCALLTYAAWWNKPKDVGQPIAIGTRSDEDQEVVRQVGAWLSTLSFPDRSLLFNGVTLYHAYEYRYCGVPGSPAAKGLPEWVQTRFQQACDADHPASSNVLPRSYWSLSAIRHWLTVLKVRYIFYWRPLPWYVDGSFIDTEEEQATNERMSLLSSLSEDTVYYIVDSPYWTNHAFIVPVAHIHAATHTVPNAQLRTGIGLALLPAVYGLPHLIGLGATFPTDVERSLWEWITIAIMVLGAETYCMAFTLATVDIWFWGVFATIQAHPDVEGVVRFVASHVKIVVCVNVLLYFLGSMFLVVVSFRQLFALPPESFTLPSWGNYWPHFG